MKSLDELRQIKERAKKNLNPRQGNFDYRVVVGMGTCGIAAGAREVMASILAEIGAKNIDRISVTQTGCIGLCQLEPLIEIYDQKDQKTTYIHMNAEKAKKIVQSHLIDKTPMFDFMMDE